jgi:hypothetical protein
VRVDINAAVCCRRGDAGRQEHREFGEAVREKLAEVQRTFPPTSR